MVYPRAVCFWELDPDARAERVAIRVTDAFRVSNGVVGAKRGSYFTGAPPVLNGVAGAKPLYGDLGIHVRHSYCNVGRPFQCASVELLADVQIELANEVYLGPIHFVCSTRPLHLETDSHTPQEHYRYRNGSW